MSKNLKLVVDNDHQETLNNAYIFGQDCPEWQALLDRQMTFLLPGDRNRDAEQKTWKNHTTHLYDWLAGGKDGALTRSIERKQKGYFPLVFGASAGTVRNANAMVSLEFITLDVDSGDSLEEAEKRIESLGLACVVWTTYSDSAQTSLIKRDEVLKGLGIVTDPTDEQVREYLTKLAKHTARHIASVAIKDQRKHTDRGVMIELAHAPLEKFRLAFPLAETLKITTLAPTQRGAQDVYKRKLRGLAEMVGVIVDKATLDVCRAFYMPSHPKGQPGHLAVIRGRGLTIGELPEVGAEPHKKGAKTGLEYWATQYAHRLELARLIECEAPDKVRPSNGGVLVVECPHDGGHGNAGDADDSACHVRDADGEKGFVWACKHDSCADNDRLAMLSRAIADGWFDRAAIEDEDYLTPLPDQDLAPDSKSQDRKTQDSKTQDGEFEDEDDWLPALYRRDRNRNLIQVKSDEGEDDEDDDGKAKWMSVCGAFDVVGRSSNADGTDGAGRILSFTNENGKRVEVTLSRSDLYADGPNVVKVLAAKGLTMFAGKKANDRLLTLLRAITPSRQIPTRVAPGWVRDENGDVQGFLAPSGEYIRAVPGTAPVRLVETARMEVVKPRGTLDGWKVTAHAAEAQNEGNPHWLLSICAAFAGPLLGLLEAPPCGFGFSGKTSKGKTEAQRLGASVYGPTEVGHGLLFSGNTTSNAPEDLATIGSEAILMLDEIGAMGDKKALEPLLFVLSSGRTKSRKAGRGAGLADGSNFRPFVIFSNENGLKAEINAAGGQYRGGLSARFCDIDVTDCKVVGADVITKLESCRQNYGHAGPAFVRHLIATGAYRDRVTLELDVETIARKLAGDSGSAIIRAARVFAMAQRAGELAVAAGLLDSADAVRGAVAKCWAIFAGSDEAGVARGGDALIEDLQSFLNAEWDLRILSVDADPLASRGRPIGWYDEDLIYLDWKAIENPATAGIGSFKREELAKTLHEAKALDKPDKGYPHSKLPAKVGKLIAEDARTVRNLRIKRGVIGF